MKLSGCVLLVVVSLLPAVASSRGQASATTSALHQAASDEQPLPAIPTLLRAVEQHQRAIEAAERDYTYHVHTVQQDLDSHGGVKKTETEDAESLTIDGIRVNRIVARNGKPLTPDEAARENERIDKVVARARERRSKLQEKGTETDSNGNAILSLSRILELGTFSNLRRTERNGRPAFQMDYAGNPDAKTHNAFEGIMRDVVGTLWVDTADQVLVAADGHFGNDFKLGAGLLADVRKGSRFQFEATRVADGLWLPAAIDGEGSVRVLLFAHFNGRLHAVTSDYRRFRASATIVGSHGVIAPDGTPLPTPPELPALPQQKPE